MRPMRLIQNKSQDGPLRQQNMLERGLLYCSTSRTTVYTILHCKCRRHQTLMMCLERTHNCTFWDGPRVPAGPLLASMPWPWVAWKSKTNKNTYTTTCSDTLLCSEVLSSDWCVGRPSLNQAKCTLSNKLHTSTTFGVWWWMRICSSVLQPHSWLGHFPYPYKYPVHLKLIHTIRWRLYFHTAVPTPCTCRANVPKQPYTHGRTHYDH